MFPHAEDGAKQGYDRIIFLSVQGDQALARTAFGRRKSRVAAGSGRAGPGEELAPKAGK